MRVGKLSGKDARLLPDGLCWPSGKSGLYEYVLMKKVHVRDYLAGPRGLGHSSIFVAVCFVIGLIGVPVKAWSQQQSSEETCHTIEDFAYNVMRHRQDGKPKEPLLQQFTNKTILAIIEEAYNEPVHDLERLKEGVSRAFGAVAFMSCMGEEKTDSEPKSSTAPDAEPQTSAGADWEYKDWLVKISRDGSSPMVRFVTQGKRIHGHEFGMIRQQGACDRDLLWLSMSSTDHSVRELQGQKVYLVARAAGREVPFGLDFLSASLLAPGSSLMLLALTNQEPGAELLEMFKQGTELEIEVIHPRDLVERLDVPIERFSLNGFIATRLKAEEYCKKL